MQTLEGICDILNYWIPVIHMGSLGWILTPSISPGPTVAIKRIWEINQQRTFILSLSLPLPLPFPPCFSHVYIYISVCVSMTPNTYVIKTWHQNHKFYSTHTVGKESFLESLILSFYSDFFCSIFHVLIFFYLTSLYM